MHRHSVRHRKEFLNNRTCPSFKNLKTFNPNVWPELHFKAPRGGWCFQTHSHSSLVRDSTQCFCVWASSVLFSVPSLGGPWDPRRDPSSVVREEGWLVATWLARGQAGGVWQRRNWPPRFPKHQAAAPSLRPFLKADRGSPQLRLKKLSRGQLIVCTTSP